MNPIALPSSTLATRHAAASEQATSATWHRGNPALQQYIATLLEGLLKRMLGEARPSPRDGGSAAGHPAAAAQPASHTAQRPVAHTDANRAGTERGTGTPAATTHAAKPPANMQVGAPTGTVEVDKPIVVKAGQTFDGQGRLFSAGPGLNGGGTAETHLPIFILEPGASVKNLQFKGGDGIHLLGDAKLDNVHGLQTDDDFITVDGTENRAVDAQRAGDSAKSISPGPARVEITNSSFQNSHDKAIQINGDVDLKLRGIYADQIGQLAVTRGGYPITAHVDIADSTAQNLKSFLFRFDSRQSTLHIANTDVDGGRTPVNVMEGNPANVQGTHSVRQSIQTV
ncbi:pectate lyase [Paracidovorax cattleyae]|uniref:Pectate lyase n=1 Tax=Paracidovorax cattleyae TaxID=80868 RepID=A0A1H0SI24_9BURK|nr:pectate lyase [Paracidovorax cattleyae]AVS75084.1 pectate lyase [Paracidovorax cattleyae]SDP41325.1 Pectate lyase [Paracidovorax cattleyae]